MDSIHEGIVAFYWVDSGGISRFRWYADVDQGIERDTQDDLLSGFLSAMMSFTREMFSGEQISHMEMMNRKIFFAVMPSNDILALATTLDFDEPKADAVLNDLLSKLENEPISPDSCTVEDPESVTNHLLCTFSEIMADVPPGDRARNVLATHWNDENLLGSLVISAIAASVDKQAKDGIDFEIQTFMDSIFWEKLAEAYKDVMATAERAFGLGLTRWMTMHLSNAVLLFVFLDTITISECYRMETPIFLIDRKAKEYIAIT